MLSVIIVNYNQWSLLQACLRSVFEQTRGLDFEVIVIDNASTDETRAVLPKEFPQVCLLANGRNAGFAAANNQGIRRARGESVLLLNPDTVVLDGALQKTLEFMDEHPEAGIAACKLLFPDRSLQRSLYSFPGLWNMICETMFLQKLFPRSRLFGSYTLTYFDYNSARQVDAACGAFLMIRREVFEGIGLLDEQFYMYSEEIDFCYRAKRAGYQVWFAPEGVVLHFWGGATTVSRRVTLWSVGAQMLFFQKHFSGPLRWTLIGLKFTGVLLRTLVYATGGIVLARRSLLRKSSCYLFAALHLAGSPWRYKHGYEGSVEPWPRV